jgi:hypothetical protein
MNFKKLRKILAISLAVCFVTLAGALGFIKLSIQKGLDDWCTKAQEAHPCPGDNVAALIAYVQSDLHSLHDRDMAVWALGQARDKRAVPILELFVTGEKCDHSKFLCQHELKKAIKLIEYPINILRIRIPVVSNQAIERYGKPQQKI